jgi:hypothetical protein
MSPPNLESPALKFGLSLFVPHEQKFESKLAPTSARRIR